MAAHTIDTGLPVPLARRVIEHAMEAYRQRFQQYEPRFGWTDEQRGEFGFRAKGMKVAGVVAVRDGAVDVDLDVPFILKPFRKRAIAVVEDEVRVWVEKAKRGEID